MDVGAEGPVPFLRGDVLELVVGALERGVVDQDVEPAELGDGALDDAPAVSLVGDVAGNQHDAAAGLLDPARGLARVVLLLGQVGDHDVGALAGEGDGYRAADAGIAAGDDRGAALELAAAFVRLLAMVGLGRHLGRVAGRLLLLLGLGWGRAGVLGILGHGGAAAREIAVACERRRKRAVPTGRAGSRSALGSTILYQHGSSRCRRRTPAAHQPGEHAV